MPLMGGQLVPILVHVAWLQRERPRSQLVELDGPLFIIIFKVGGIFMKKEEWGIIN